MLLLTAEMAVAQPHDDYCYYSTDFGNKTAKVLKSRDVLSDIVIGNTGGEFIENGTTYEIIGIEQEAFKGNTYITSATINFSDTKHPSDHIIDRSAFENCTNLQSVTMNDGVTEIERNAFAGCTSLKSITLSNNITYIGKGAFEGCSSLQSVTIPNKVEVIDKNTFKGCTSLQSVTIPEGVKEIDNSAFRDCSSLKSITIPASVTSIGKNVFRGCTEMTDVYCYANPNELKWSEPPSFNETTQIHVPFGTADGWRSIFGTASNIVEDTPNNMGALSLTKDADGKMTATLYDNEQELAIVNNQTEVQSVVITREFISNTTSTVVLPFDIAAGQYSGGKFYAFSNMEYKYGKWVAEMKEEVNSITAHTPYLFVPTATTLTITGGVTLKSGSPATVERNGWQFIGVYEKKTWKTSENDDYGFAGYNIKEGSGIVAGEFVHAGKKAWVNPMRCYLHRMDGAPLSKSTSETPERIEVRLISAVEEPGDPSENPEEITTPVSELAPTLDNVKVWSYDHTIFIESVPGTNYRIVDVAGRLLKAGATSTTRDEVRLGGHGGITVVIINNKTFKINY